MEHSIRLTNYQLETLQSRQREVLLSGGIGSGKSYTGAHWVLSKVVENPNCRILIAANTYSQLMLASVQTLTELLDSLGIPYEATLSGAKKRIEIGKAICYLYSLEKYDNIRGIEVDFAWLDEIAFSKKEALDVVRGRLRGKHSSYRQILMTSSPNGFNFLYDIFGNLQPNSNKQLIRAETQQNIFLPDGYYLELLEAYGGANSPLARQELFGEFVNLQEGAIYNLFSRENNVRPCKLDKKYQVFVGVDFNVDKMSAVYVQYIEGKFKMCGEVQLTHRNANTFDLGQKIIEDLKGFSFQVVPDSTGKSRKSNSSTTDHQILKDLGISVMETHNPEIRDRQNTVNIHFLKQMCEIDGSCTKVIKEIETLSSRDTEGDVCHISVCLGYVIWKLNPIIPKHRPSQTIQR